VGRFLHTVWPFPTHVQPNLAVARALSERGHDVAFYTGPDAAGVVASEGFRVFPFRAVDGAEVGRALDSITSRRGSPHSRGLLWRRFLLETVPAQLADIEAVRADWSPDVLVCDLAMWGPILVTAESSSIPAAVLSHLAFCMLPGAMGPVPGVVLPPPRGAMARLHARLAAGLMHVVAHGLRRTASRIRSDHGLARLGTTVTGHGGKMGLYLVPSVPELDYSRRDLPASVHYVGPCLWGGPGPDAALGWPEGAEAGGRRVLVVEGNLHGGDPELPRLAARALVGPGLQSVILLGERREAEAAASLAGASESRVGRGLPSRPLLDGADVVVTSGNSDATLAALAAARPVLVMPRLWDQGELAWRVADAGAGLRLRRGARTPEAFREAVERVAATPSFGLQARRLADSLGGRGGPRRAAELLEGLLEGRRPTGDREADEREAG
jgi:N-glycosyltransferase StaG